MFLSCLISSVALFRSSLADLMRENQSLIKCDSLFSHASLSFVVCVSTLLCLHFFLPDDESPGDDLKQLMTRRREKPFPHTPNEIIRAIRQKERNFVEVKVSSLVRLKESDMFAQEMRASEKEPTSCRLMPEARGGIATRYLFLSFPVSSYSCVLLFFSHFSLLPSVRSSFRPPGPSPFPCTENLLSSLSFKASFAVRRSSCSHKSLTLCCQ